MAGEPDGALSELQADDSAPPRIGGRESAKFGKTARRRDCCNQLGVRSARQRRFLPPDCITCPMMRPLCTWPLNNTVCLPF